MLKFDFYPKLGIFLACAMLVLARLGFERAILALNFGALHRNPDA
jgi:hypothetical protein